ncbi:NADH-ubiquinone oxidoreductase-F iron-sulfur binding region domain-containing protein [Nonomuraea spiralis]|uniref:NADH-ubiquinone oxidoreductase-F iron-sulfur binding region domain-containing protein n=1 Tax=Nonomuraea spiralis TaxID=46182 RepID=A0ABV5IVC8_9ACTN|nr:NADH-ubiquinone oxidoreductase-F iron-sulfur binding region domain-containing protein [Nonomuraea spiralis]GGT16796.1 NADH dehydrogenase [Nonomuraea spiralis]
MSFPVPVRSLGPARLSADPPAGGPEPTGEQIVESAAAAGVQGRGGAGFPLAVKLRAVRSGFVIANGEEGEPASVKDRYLLRERSSLVIRGLELAARAVDAERAFLYLSDPVAAARMGAAAPAGVEIVQVPPAYVAGEETAAVRAVGGGPALPSAKPPRPWQSGLGGRPTLVSNVETLAQLATAVHLGPEAYRAVGTGDSPGTFLATVSGAAHAPTLYEVPYGMPFGELVAHHLGSAAGVTGVIAGGFAGGLLPASALALPMTHADFSRAGSTLGCGAFVLLAGDCPIGVAAEMARFFDEENARQCGSCVKGSAGVAAVLARLGTGAATGEDVERLERWGRGLAGRGNCATPDAVSVLVGSLFRHHRELVRAHVGARCPRCAPHDFRIRLEENP